MCPDTSDPVTDLGTLAKLYLISIWHSPGDTLNPMVGIISKFLTQNKRKDYFMAREGRKFSSSFGDKQGWILSQ